jgi:hypothetical protein
MSNPWFRMYHEWDSDPKVQMMSEPMQRRLVMLFCLQCKGETLHETELAFHWRISEEELAKTKALFTSKGFIDENWNLANWNRRQFLSDSSTDRVRRFRSGKKQDETLHETPVTVDETKPVVTVTPPDTDTEQIQNREEGKKKKTPRAKTNHPSIKSVEDDIPDGLPVHQYATGLLEIFSMSRASAYAVYVAMVEALPMLARDEGCELGEAARRMLQRMRAAEKTGKVRWRYWLGEDAGWKQPAVFSLGLEDDNAA